jgi:triphosphatase
MPPDDPFTRKIAVLEREIKLYVPVARQAAIERELTKHQATVLSLHARYFDTEERELAEAGIALRLRKEGDQWVQTLKMAGPDEQSRIELNYDRPEATLDLSVYSDTALLRTLRKLRGPLVQRYETQIERRLLRLSTPDSTIELAYDRGVINAGASSLPVSELEFEYVAGDLAALFDVSKQWLKKYRLVMDLRSKAERGDALANLAVKSATPSAPDSDPAPQDTAESTTASLHKARKASHIRLRNDMSATQAYLACANDCLNQIVRNSAYLAGVDGIQAAAGHQVALTHQARVGIRRLRSCWRFFDGWLDLDDDALVQPLRSTFEAFGKARDMDVIREDIAPCLAYAGMPALQTMPDQQDYAAQASAAAASPAFQEHLLDLARHLFELSERSAGDKSGSNNKGDHGPKLRKAVAKKLSNWQTKIATEGVLFKLLSCEQQHDLRKKIKRLRYAMEFSDSLLKDSEFEHTLPILLDAQHILGDMNDLYTAVPYYEELTASQPEAWFAVGWLKATQVDLQNQAQHIFEQLALTTLSEKKLNRAVSQAANLPDDDAYEGVSNGKKAATPASKSGAKRT